jgi:hypothetical protein
MRPFSQDSVFYRIPRSLNAHERLAIEGVRNSILMIFLHYDRIRETACAYRIPAESSEVSEMGQRLTIIADAWAVVDCANRLRTLLERYPSLRIRENHDVRRFLTRSKRAVTLRNRFQHLAENLPRRVEITRASQTLFGELTWIFIPDGEGEIRSAQVYGVAIGGTPHDSDRQQASRITAVGGAKVEVPVGRFELHAFDECLNLSELMTNIRTLIPGLEVFLAEDFQKRAQLIAEKNGILVSELMEPSLESSGFRLDVRFDSTPGLPADSKMEIITSFRTPRFTF